MRFTLSFRDVEALLAERGIDVSNETVRRWFLKSAQLVAVNLRHSRPVDHEGEVPEFLVQRRRIM